MKFATLISFTEKGIQNIRSTTDRAAAFTEKANQAGITVSQLLWLTGRFDGLVVFDAPDPQTASAAMLQLSMIGNVKTESLQAFTSDEMNQVVGKIN